MGPQPRPQLLERAASLSRVADSAAFDIIVQVSELWLEESVAAGAPLAPDGYELPVGLPARRRKAAGKPGVLAGLRVTLAGKTGVPREELVRLLSTAGAICIVRAAGATGATGATGAAAPHLEVRH